MNDMSQLLSKMWNEYTSMNPQAQMIFNLLTSEGENVINDHIALRTFDHPRVCIDVLAKPFLASGYVEKEDYQFVEKKLYAKHFEHSDPNFPTVFISQLKTAESSNDLQNLVGELIGQLSDDTIASFDFMAGGRPWTVTTKQYENLKKESDYAAWVSAFGYQPNHFTVFINVLKKYSDISALNNFLKSKGIKLNDSGGEIKGSVKVLLEQSSTLANNIEVEFSDGKLTIPACYYEFAKRYPLADGSLYQGFVAKSADKIFESTDKGQ